MHGVMGVSMSPWLRIFVPSLIVATTLAGCGSESETQTPNAPSGATASPVRTSTAGSAAGTPTLRSGKRFDLGVASAALPAGWKLMDTSDARVARRLSIKAHDSLDGFVLVRKGADPNTVAGSFPLIAIDQGVGADRPKPGQSFAALKQATADAMARLAQAGFSGFKFLDDTTLDGMPTAVSEVMQTSSGPSGTSVVAHRTLGAMHGGELYRIAVSARGRSVPDDDLLALETVRSTWQWKAR